MLVWVQAVSLHRPCIADQNALSLHLLQALFTISSHECIFVLDILLKHIQQLTVAELVIFVYDHILRCVLIFRSVVRSER